MPNQFHPCSSEIMNRVILGSVIIEHFLPCRNENGMTEPLSPLRYHRTTANLVPSELLEYYLQRKVYQMLILSPYKFIVAGFVCRQSNNTFHACLVSRFNNIHGPCYISLYTLARLYSAVEHCCCRVNNKSIPLIACVKFFIFTSPITNFNRGSLL